MTQEEFDFLSGYEYNFHTILEASWSPAIPMTDATRMYEIYKTYNPGHSINLNCSRCVGDMLRVLGKLYLEQKQTQQEEQETNEASPKSKRKKS